jgi:hypothetical protein
MKTMKTIMTTLIMILSVLITQAQTVTYSDVVNQITTKGKFTEYVSRDGTVYRIGDRVEFGSPSGINGKFVTIQKMDVMGTAYPVGAEIINTSAEIKSIWIGGSKRTGFKVNFQTKGFTFIDNYFIPIEDAIQTGEVKTQGITSDEALQELKRAKDKLDLGLITPEEYYIIREELSKFIK